ncbi:hypothetical protein P7D22_22480 [Lichenihabitans sp. Uapishka_5]|uniref:hypothetical protein n=1 Tax=Lichenihabitans sp. Uapishka_5 TaxID=3037302 RepID=UPI0029E7FF17|nr:hypothetical protein [Lichenihabitans sp. Uapishka_5]MDX7953925.1 hypothetical protein [Lichenihabitans sp. Uapishka_5]
MTVTARADEHSRDLAGVSLGQGYDDMFRKMGRCEYGNSDRHDGVLNCDTSDGEFQAHFAGDAPTVAYSLTLRFCSGEGFLVVEKKVEDKYGMALGMEAPQDFEWTRPDGLHVTLLGPSSTCERGDGYALSISDDAIDKRYRDGKALRDAAEASRVPTPKF